MKLKEVLIPLLESFKDAKKIFNKEWPWNIVEPTLEDFKQIRRRLSPPENDISHWIKKDFSPFYIMVQREEKYHAILDTVQQEGFLDEQTINTLRITEEEYNNEI